MPINNLFQMDFRIKVLENIITGLTKSMKLLEDKNKTIQEFDGLSLAEEIEPVIGLSFVAFQNYITGTISDLKKYSIDPKAKTIRKHQFYLEDKVKIENKLTSVELIVWLANYYKHKDEEINQLTKDNLNKYNLLNEDLPVNEGLTLLSKNWDLYEVTEYVVGWRRNLEQKYFKVGHSAQHRV
jgi:hypothetical protein